MERATIDLMQGSLDNPTVIGALIDRGSTTNWFGRVGQLYFSKRLASCGLMASTPF